VQLLGGRTADEMRSHFDNGDVSTIETAFRNANFNEYTFKIRAKGIA
jgi:hypothetical protein